MVRLVFRPYTQFRRSICTSESLRTSIRVSPDFVLTRHSSPSFGSQRVRSWCASSRNENETPRECEAASRRGPSSLDRRQGRSSLSLRLWVLLVPMTRAHVRLLGPCFKTGPKSTQSSSVADRYQGARRDEPIRRPVRPVKGSPSANSGPEPGTALGPCLRVAWRALATGLTQMRDLRPDTVRVPPGSRPGEPGVCRVPFYRRRDRHRTRAVDRHPAGRDVLLGEKCTTTTSDMRAR